MEVRHRRELNELVGTAAADAIASVVHTVPEDLTVEELAELAAEHLTEDGLDRDGLAAALGIELEDEDGEG